MKFVQFLNESTDGYKKKISLETALEIAKKSKFDSKNMIFRGMGDSGDYLIIDGSKGGRTSANTKNYYTLILDELLKNTQYPLRSKSIICSTDKGAAQDYGDLYVIIPLEGSTIGSTNHSDIWNMSFNALGTKDPMVDFNDHYVTLEIKDKSYETIVKGLKSVADNDLSNFSYDSDLKYAAKEIKNVFKNEKTVEKDLATLYGSIIDQFTLHNPGDALKKKSEVWIGGPCLAVKFHIFMDEIFDEL